MAELGRGGLGIAFCYDSANMPQLAAVWHDHQGFHAVGGAPAFAAHGVLANEALPGHETLAQRGAGTVLIVAHKPDVAIFRVAKAKNLTPQTSVSSPKKRS
jgi:hypothetical protein